MSNENSLKELSTNIRERGLNTVKGELEERFTSDDEKFRTLREEWGSVKEQGLLPEDFTPQSKHDTQEEMIGPLLLIQSHYKELYKVMVNIAILLEQEGYVSYHGPLKDVTTMMDTMDQTYREIDFLLSEMEDYIQERPDTTEDREFIAEFLETMPTLLDEIDRATVTEDKIIPIQTGIRDVQTIVERIKPNVSGPYYNSVSEKLSDLRSKVGSIQSAIQMRNAPPGPAYSAPFPSYTRSTFRSADLPASRFAFPTPSPSRFSFPAAAAAGPSPSRFSFPAAAAAGPSPSRFSFPAAAAAGPSPSRFAFPREEPPREKAKARAETPREKAKAREEPPREKAKAKARTESPREQTEEEKAYLEKERCRRILSEYGILTMGRLDKKKFLQEFSREYHPDKSGVGPRAGEDDATTAEKAAIFQTVSSCYGSHQWGGQKRKRMTKRRHHRNAKTHKAQKTQKN